MPPKYRLCPKCKYRYERIKQKCPNCAAARPKKRVPKHAQTLRDHTYEDYINISKQIHGVEDESCCVCRKPKAEGRRHDRDHDHKTGNPRGLACHLDNRSMPHWLTAHRAQLIADYLKRVEDFYGKNTKPKATEGQCAETQYQRSTSANT